MTNYGHILILIVARLFSPVSNLICSNFILLPELNWRASLHDDSGGRQWEINFHKFEFLSFMNRSDEWKHKWDITGGRFASHFCGERFLTATKFQIRNLKVFYCIRVSVDATDADTHQALVFHIHFSAPGEEPNSNGSKWCFRPVRQDETHSGYGRHQKENQNYQV